MEIASHTFHDLGNTLDKNKKDLRQTLDERAAKRKTMGRRERVYTKPWDLMKNAGSRMYYAGKTVADAVHKGIWKP